MYGSLIIYPQLFSVFLKASIFSKTGCKKLRILLISKFEKLFKLLNSVPNEQDY